MSTEGFFRPIEITSSSDGVTLDGTPYTITQKLYECLWTLVYALDAKFATEDANYHVRLYDQAESGSAQRQPRVQIANADAVDTLTVTWTEDTLRDLLGFDATQDPLVVGPLSTAEANYAPKYCWFPFHGSYDRERYQPLWDERASLQRVKSGRLSGIGTASKRYQRKYQYAHEPAVNVRESAATSAFTAVRNLEYFWDACRTTSPQVVTTANPLGCYYLPDWTVYTGASPTVAIPSSMDEGGINFDYSSSPDRYLYCHATERVDLGSSASIPVGRDYYNVEFSLLSAETPW